VNDDWSLAIKDMSWVEHTREEVDFVIEALGLGGGEKVLDLACGFGRHALELARRGYCVVVVDITPDYIADARATAAREGLKVDFLQGDVRAVPFVDEFDVVLNMADGAIGYFPTDEEDLELFDAIARALRVGGKHVMGVCSAAHAAKHYPKSHWEAGSRMLSLADFRWNAATSRMIYRSHALRYGEPLAPMADSFPPTRDIGTRLYTLEELDTILGERGLRIEAAYGGYDTATPASSDHLMQVVCSCKER